MPHRLAGRQASRTRKGLRFVAGGRREVSVVGDGTAPVVGVGQWLDDGLQAGFSKEWRRLGGRQPDAGGPAAFDEDERTSGSEEVSPRS